MENTLKCSKCGSENVNVQIVSENIVAKDNNRGCLYGAFYLCFVAWWIWLVKLLFGWLKWFKPNKEYTNTKHRKMCICQQCGNSWEIE